MAVKTPNVSAKVDNIAGLIEVCRRLGYFRSRGTDTGTEPSINALINAIANGEAVVTRNRAIVRTDGMSAPDLKTVKDYKVKAVKGKAASKRKISGE